MITFPFIWFFLRIGKKVKSGSVWESNPQRALFKPATGFEDQGHHQMCKHSRGFFYLSFKRLWNMLKTIIKTLPLW